MSKHRALAIALLVSLVAHLAATFALAKADEGLRRLASEYKDHSFSWERQRSLSPHEYEFVRSASGSSTPVRLTPAQFLSLKKRAQAQSYADILNLQIDVQFQSSIDQWATDTLENRDINFAASIMPQRLESIARQAYAFAPLRTCHAYLGLPFSPDRPLAGVWQDICFRLDGPDPSDYPLSRVYSDGTFVKGGAWLEYWQVFMGYFPWVLAAIAFAAAFAKLHVPLPPTPSRPQRPRR